MRLRLEMLLDSAQPYEKLVYDTIMAVPYNAQKDFIVSAILHYSKSPSFLVEVKMGEYLEEIKKLNAVFQDPRYTELLAASTAALDSQSALVGGIADAVTERVAKVLDGLDVSGPRRKGPGAQRVETPEEVMSGMMKDFGTDGAEGENDESS